MHNWLCYSSFTGYTFKYCFITVSEGIIGIGDNLDFGIGYIGIFGATVINSVNFKLFKRSSRFFP